MNNLNAPPLPQGAEVFETLNNVLLALDYPSRVQALSHEVPVPAMMLGPYPFILPSDEAEEADTGARPTFALALFFVSDLLQHLQQENSEASDSLVFELTIPIEINASRRAELALLAIQLNNLLPYGQFQVPVNRAPLMKYERPTFEKEPLIQLSVEIITTLLFFYNKLADLFEAVNIEDLSVDDAVFVAGERLANAGSEIEGLLEESARVLRESNIEL